MDWFDPARIAMLTAGSGLLVGSVGPEGVPLAVRAWSASITDAGRVRVAMSADDPTAIANARDGWVALTGADVRTLDSVQLKGRVVTIEPPDADDLDVVALQSHEFFTAVHETDGFPIGSLRKLMPNEIVMIEIEILEVFDQTPGPGAGAAIGTHG
jgi:hypothetical protein